MSWPQTVRKGDLRIDYYRGSGKGGQHRNKTDSACRLTHLLTGVTAQSEEHKEQSRNRKEAFLRLAAKLVPLMKAQLSPRGRDARTAPGMRERIRTYNGVRQVVVDHRTNRKYGYRHVLDGPGLGDVIRDNMRL